MHLRAIIVILFIALGHASPLQAQALFPNDVLQNPSAHRSYFESILPITEVEVYTPSRKEQVVVLENGYAQAAFQSQDWPPQDQEVIPTAVNIIFTKYPKERSFWLTDYHWLLAKRLEALFELDPRFNAKNVEFRITLQTSCDNEFEAMQLFHGMELYYKPVNSSHQEIHEEPSKKTASHSPSSQNPSEVKRIQRFMVRQRYYMDSTVFNVLDRHPEWQDALLVIDWTGSMYGHGAEALMWHAMNEDYSGIKYVALFNDGDRKQSRKKQLGRTGGIYFSNALPVHRPIKLFNKVKNKGKGGDSAENDIEAVYEALREFPKAKEVVLIADNRSCIRDFVLLSCLQRPVRVILCDTRKGINHQYLNLAWKTGGSLHGEGFDFDSLHLEVAGDSLEFLGESFSVSSDGWILPKDRLSNGGFGYCTRYYKAPRRTIRKSKRRRKEPKCYFTE